MERRYYVYEHREADTGRTFYVGKGFGNRAWRMDSRNNHWNNVRNKHGLSVHLVYEGLSERQAFYIESEIISAYGRENLCNLTDGGEGISNPSIETRRKLSESHKGIKKSHEERLAMSHRMMGEKNHWYGAKFSDGHKKNLSVALSGRTLTKEHAKKIGESNIKREVHIFLNEKLGGLNICPRNEMLEYGLSKCEISMLCRGKRRVAQGWTVIG